MTNPYDRIARVPSFTLKSSDIADGARLPMAQVGSGAGGTDTSPQLTWEGFPSGTKSFVVSVFDPDAPTASGFWHWVVADLPPNVRELPAGAGEESGRAIPAPAWQLRNDAGQRRYRGATPPVGHGRHTYFTAVHAIDLTRIPLDHDCTPAVLMFTIHTHTLARAVLAPWWER